MLSNQNIAAADAAAILLHGRQLTLPQTCLAIRNCLLLAARRTPEATALTSILLVLTLLGFVGASWPPCPWCAGPISPRAAVNPHGM